jgi:hypothetical protein
MVETDCNEVLGLVKGAREQANATAGKLRLSVIVMHRIRGAKVSCDSQKFH